MVIKIEHYTNERGMKLKEHMLVSSDSNKKVKLDRFIGSVGVGIQTPFGAQVEEIEFPIEANSIEDAFSKFESSANAFVNELRKNAQEAQKRIELPNAQQVEDVKKSKLIMP